jgi:hypothetical protein
MSQTAMPTIEYESAQGKGTVHVGERGMPPWKVAELPDAPRFTWRNWLGLIGPGLLMGGSSIAGGEWLMGPSVTAKYGASLMWLATLSILGQVFYNIEVSRYALYTGEPMLTGKFRTAPGPKFWLVVYLFLDFGAVFPYLASNAATPVVTAALGHVPQAGDRWMITLVGIAIFLLTLIPLVVGGKVYSSLKALISVKVVVVLGFLLFLAVTLSSWQTWSEIVGGFFQFGTVPISGEGFRTRNVFLSLWHGEGMPAVDFSNIVTLAALASIAGSGGLSNMVISNYTREQGWGMGRHVGAIPSIVGGRQIALAHTGAVFEPTADALPRWRRWLRHVRRDQLAIWMPACFIGLALPSMLSLMFIPRGTDADQWTGAVMTADGARQHVTGLAGTGWGAAVWYGIVLCGFLVLAPTAATTADGVVRRWVDVFWTASPRLRQLDERKIKQLYFRVLVAYALLGLVLLAFTSPGLLVKIATNIMNFALGISCFHTLYVNLTLLPEPLRPRWFARAGLVLAGIYFLTLAGISGAYTASTLFK